MKIKELVKMLLERDDQEQVIEFMHNQDNVYFSAVGYGVDKISISTHKEEDQEVNLKIRVKDLLYANDVLSKRCEKMRTRMNIVFEELLEYKTGGVKICERKDWVLGDDRKCINCKHFRVNEHNNTCATNWVTVGNGSFNYVVGEDWSCYDFTKKD